jgi:hypothetical protein
VKRGRLARVARTFAIVVVVAFVAIPTAVGYRRSRRRSIGGSSPPESRK